MPSATRRGAGRPFSVWGIRPVCTAEEDVRGGGLEFPERLVGHCQDAPLEHVVSSHPVSADRARVADPPRSKGLIRQKQGFFPASEKSKSMMRKE